MNDKPIFEALEPRILLSFTDVTAAIFPVSNIGAPAWGDYNNDGWTDVATGGRLYENNNGVFTDIGPVGGGQSYWGDFNNDGYLDLLNNPGGGGLSLSINNGGDGTFAGIGIGNFPSNTASQGAALGDFNGDGWLDVYVGGFESWPTDYWPDYVAMSTGELTYQMITQPIGGIRPARGVTAVDYNEDGNVDVYVSNYRLEANYLWKNNGSGSTFPFSDAGASGGSGHAIGSAFGDLDSDGDVDIFAGNFAHSGQPQSRVYRNNGPGSNYSLTDIGSSGVFYQEAYTSPALGDYDNDGYLDLFFNALGPGQGYGSHGVLFHNNGNPSFSDVTGSQGLPENFSGYEASWADYDNDGDLDLSVSGKLYRNNLNSTNKWLKVNIGADGNTIGAIVKVTAGGKTITRQVESGTGQGNQNDINLHFGLGNVSGSVSGEIRWLDGTTQQFTSQVNKSVNFSNGVAVTLPFFEDFNDGVADVFNEVSGAWNVNGAGKYVAKTTSGERAVSVVNIDGDLPEDTIISATMRLRVAEGLGQQDGMVIFDYQSIDDFRFAGIWANVDKLRLGRYNASNGGWNFHVEQTEVIDVGAVRDHTLEVKVNGNTVDVILDGVQKINRAYGSSIADGEVGIGNRATDTVFDDFRVSRPSLLPYSENFDDGVDDLFQRNLGTWVVNGAGRYVGKKGINGRTVSVVPIEDDLVGLDVIEINATAKTREVLGQGKNAFIVYDYIDENNFKFAGLWDGIDQWKMGRYKNGQWIFNASLDEVIDTNVEYNLTVRIDNTTFTTTLFVNGVEKLSYQYLGNLLNGDMGLGTKNADSVFDNFQIVSA
tara:strand:+ start:680 stop:3142 length:2463 start_codon:yes stop_codon:yes gene_type:complete